MSTPKKPSNALLFVAGLFSEKTNFNLVTEKLIEIFGNISFSSMYVPFLWSNYYENEMGKNLKRVFFVFEIPVERNFLVDAKKRTDNLELEFSIKGLRTINLDAGIITKENILLATNKAFFHRIYLQNGVYSEVTLFYKNNTYRGIEYWRYPEYSSSAVIDFFNTARNLW